MRTRTSWLGVTAVAWTLGIAPAARLRADGSAWAADAVAKPEEKAAAQAAGKQANPAAAAIPSPAGLIFSIDATPDQGRPPLQVQFSVTSYEDADEMPQPKYTWNFGDGSPESHEEKPAHTFTKAGEYKVTLKITAANQQSGVDDTEIDVGEDTE